MNVLRGSSLPVAMISKVLPLEARLFLRFMEHRLFKSSRCFSLDGSFYRYFYARYNHTWANERAVEIPIVYKVVCEHKGKRILEVGNVLSHYFPVRHDVLDKYERGAGVINEDVVDFRPSQKYDLIVSISTLEHIGWDEKPRNPEKLLAAVENLEGHLARGGQLLATLPLGYNPGMDDQLCRNKLPFTRVYCLRRVSRDNRWVESSWHDVEGLKYGDPFPAANGLVIGVIEKSG